MVEFEERQLAPKLEPATAEPRVSIFVSIIYLVSAGRQITRCQMPVQVPRMFYVETSEFGRPLTHPTIPLITNHRAKALLGILF